MLGDLIAGSPREMNYSKMLLKATVPWVDF